MKTSKTVSLIFAMITIFSIVLTACGPAATDVVDPVTGEEATEESENENPDQDISTEPTTLSMWYHGAGNEVERNILLQVIDDFNTSQSEYIVEVQDFPQISYNESIVAAALAGNLPDIVDVDGPVMPNWAWAGYLAPLQLSDGALDGFLPTTIGKWEDEVPPQSVNGKTRFTL